MAGQLETCSRRYIQIPVAHVFSETWALFKGTTSPPPPETQKKNKEMKTRKCCINHK